MQEILLLQSEACLGMRITAKLAQFGRETRAFDSLLDVRPIGGIQLLSRGSRTSSNGLLLGFGKIGPEPVA